MPVVFTSVREGLTRSVSGRIAEWGLGLIVLLWGGVLVMHEKLMAVPPYDALSDWLPQPLWAAICLGIGGGRLVVLTINGAWSRSPHLRTLASFLSGFFFLQVSLAFVKSGTAPTLLAVYPVLCGMDLFAMIRSAREARIVDDAKG